jgi:hypothetical protein
MYIPEKCNIVHMEVSVGLIKTCVNPREIYSRNVNPGFTVPKQKQKKYTT